MKVAIVCFPTPGGSGVVAAELGNELARRGHEIHVLSYRVPFRMDSENSRMHYHEVELKEYPLFPHPLITVEITARLVEVIERHSLDLVHVHYALPNSVSALLAREMAGRSVKIITTVHGTDITIWGRDKSLQPVIRYSLEKSDLVTAVSESLRREAVEILGVEKEIHTIYNFIDTGVYRRSGGEKLRLKLAPGGEKIVLHVSNFRPVKRIPDLLHAFALLQETNRDVVLALAGDGVERNRVAELSEKLGLKERVRFLGIRKNMVPLFSAADLFVLPSEKESFGLAALEAMACSVPVIATNTGGLPELVDHGQNGFLVPVGDRRALCEAMRELLDDDSLRGRFARNSREKAKLFSSEVIIPRYEALYRGISSPHQFR